MRFFVLFVLLLVIFFYSRAKVGCCEKGGRAKCTVCLFGFMMLWFSLDYFNVLFIPRVYYLRFTNLCF